MAAPRWLLLLAALWRVGGGVKVEGVKKHNHGEIDEDEFTWAKLNGRCCFLRTEVCPFEGAPRELCTKSSPSSCRECNVWSEPDNYCHLSEDNCLSCGMQLYCPRPPPLLDGNKLCTKSSRVGQGCMDEQDTGLCANNDFSDCEDACRANSACQLFVFYPEERRGSCVLCRDLFSFERTPEAATRAYAVTPAAPPPSSSKNRPQIYSIVMESPPPHPPHLSPPPSPTQLGHHRAPGGHEHTYCKFDEGVEYTVDKQEGYVILTATSKDDCCALCGRSGGCTDFVFEPETGTCVVLSHVIDENEIEAYPNPSVVSGSIRISIAPTVIPSSACNFVDSAGYAQGVIGRGEPILGGSLLTKEDCCQSCGATPRCAKFAWQDASKTCTLYQAFAELVRVQDQIAGTVSTKLIGLGTPTIAVNESLSRSTTKEWLPMEMPPSMPSLAALSDAMPPPPVPPGKSDSDVTQMIIERMSLLVVTIMMLTCVLCVYLFFSPQILSAAYQLTGGKVGRPAAQHTRVPGIEPPAEMGEVSYPMAKKQTTSLTASTAKVSVESDEMRQSRQMDISKCSTLNSFRHAIFREFSMLLSGVHPSKGALFCLAPVKGDDQSSLQTLMWCLVTERSDVSQVLACTNFRLVLDMEDESMNEITVAFEQKLRVNQHTDSQNCEHLAAPDKDRSKRLKVARPSTARRIKDEQEPIII
ncbi:MAG: hypothetical protein SGPRY_010137 [Prymnesium sp.]